MIETRADGGVTVTVRVWNVPMPLPDESQFVASASPAPISDVKYGLYYVAGDHWTWGTPGSPTRLTTEEMAEALLRRHLDLARGLGTRTARGNWRHDP